MSEKIKVVAGDALPIIKLQLLDELTGEAVNLTTCTRAVVYLTKPGSTNLIATINCTVVQPATDGFISFNFAGGILNGLEGAYQGEVELMFPIGTQTVYKPLNFNVRRQVA